MLDELKFQRVLGKGGMGLVWLADHPSLGPVAAKFVLVKQGRGEAVARALRNEVRAAARMHHPGVVNVISTGITSEALAPVAQIEPGSPYMIMEYVEGDELSSAFPEPTTAYWDCIFQLLDALAHVHARDVVHRDLKPSNVMITRDNQTQLLDLGVAQIFEIHNFKETLTSALGTPRYMSPEQIQGRLRDQGPWTDIYSVGCMVFKDLTGRSPYDAESALDLMAQHLDAPIPSLPDSMSVELNRWVRRCLAKDPAERFRFAAHAARELKSILLPPVSTTHAADSDQTLNRTTAPTQRLAAPKRKSRELPVLVADQTFQFPSWRTVENKGANIIWTPELFSMRAFPVAGMQAERDAVWAELERATRGEPRVIGLEGDAGTGRGELARWLVEAAHETGVAVPLMVEFSDPPLPTDGLAPAFGRLLECRGLPLHRRFDRIRHHRLLQLAELPEEDRINIATGLASLLTTSKESVSGNLSTPESVRRLLVATTEAVSTTQPLVMVVRHPARSKLFLSWLAAVRKTGARILVLAMGEGTGLQVDRAITVADPTAAEAVDIATSEFGLSETVAMQLVNEGKANRFLMRQLLDDWVSRGVLAPGPRGVDFTGEIPSRTQNMWTRRYELATDGAPEAWVAAFVLALLGARFESSLFVSACQRLGLSDKERWFDVIRDMGFVQVNAGQVRWVHSAIHDSFLRRAKDSITYRGIAQACGQTLANSSDYLLRLAAAKLFQEIGELEHAMSIMIETGIQVDALNAFSALEEVADQLSELQDSLEGTSLQTARSWTLLWRSKLVRREGRSDEARALAANAMTHAKAVGGAVVAHAWLQLAISNQTSAVDDALAHYQACIESATEPVVAMTARTGYAWALLNNGRLEQASAYIEANEGIATRMAAADPISSARWNKIRAYLFVQVGKLDQAETCLFAGLSALGELDSGGIRASLLTDLAEVNRARGDIPKSIEYLLEAQRHFAFTADNRMSIIQSNLVMVYLQDNQWSEAKKALASISRDFQDIEPLLLMMGASIQAHAGDFNALQAQLQNFDPPPFVKRDLLQVLEFVQPYLPAELQSLAQEKIDAGV